LAADFGPLIMETGGVWLKNQIPPVFNLLSLKTQISDSKFQTLIVTKGIKSSGVL
jgi:hypothetical protein